ncbi:MAG: DUF2207 domain-containing protein [Vicinamibacterales bacterium]
MRFVAVAFVFTAAFSARPAAAQKTYSAERFDVEIGMEPDRSLHVTETIVFRFEGEPFTRAFRTLSTARSDGISGIEGALDGRPLPRGRRDGTLEIDRENGIEVTWRFPPTVARSRTLKLSYHVAGAVTDEPGGDELYWTPLPTRHDYPIRASTIRLRLPAGARLASPPQARRGKTGWQPAPALVEDGVVTIDAGFLEPDASLVARIAFEPGTFSAAPPRWQAKQRLNRRYLPVFLTIGLVVVAAGIGGVFVLRHAHAYEGCAGDRDERSVPPDEMPPALAGTLVRSGARPAWPQAFAALVDMARRGVVSIDEGQAGRFRGRQFFIRSGHRPASLRPHEEHLLEAIFKHGEGWQDSVPAADAARRVQKEWKRFRAAIDQEMRAEGLIDAGRVAAGRLIRNAAIVLIVAGGLGFVAAVLLSPAFGDTTLMLPAALDITGVIWLITAATFPRLSDSGAMRAGRWRGFIRFLRGTAKGGNGVADALVFDRYLPYAAAFGLGSRWAKFFGGLERPVPVPPWFRAFAAAPDGGAKAFSAFIAYGSASSGSHGTGAAGGSAGAGGGGASGAS